MDIFKKILNKLSDGVDKLQRDEQVQGWLDQLSEAEKREKSWRKEGQRVVELYEQQSSADDSSQKATFNILFANTETLAPAVYNNTPRPVVKRKVDRENPVAIACAQVLKSTLTFLTDTGDLSETSFDDLQKGAVLEALVPGRGLVRYSYDANTEAAGTVTSEYICGDPVPWNRVVYGYAKVAAKIPWQAFEHFMTREECVANFGEDKGNAIKLTHAPSDDKDREGDAGNKGPENADGVKFAHIWEIWDKRDKKIKFLSEGYPAFIEERDDELKLENFFNTPNPIQFITRVSSLCPQTLYLMYEEQAKELEDVTRRIGHLTRAMKIRGFYDGTLDGLDKLLSEPENTLLPARNVNAMQNGMTLDKSIWFMPLEKLITVLQQLYVNRQQIISVIHQITGIADIMRGSSAASETLGAQKMKEAWGTMRLKRMQKEVQRFTRDSYRIMAELAAKHFSQETFAKMTGLKFPTGVEKQQAQAAMQQLMMQADQLQAQAQQGGQQLDPQQGQALQAKAGEIQAVLSKPSWDEIVAFLRNDSIRNFVIDIETNSTIDVEASEDKEELAEMMTSMGQLLNGVLPMVEKGILPFQAAKALMLFVSSRYRMGDEVEETFRAMQEPKPQEDPAAKKVEAEMQRDQQAADLDAKAKQAELAQQAQLAQMEMQFKQKELQMKERELAMKMQFAEAKHKLDMETLVMKATMPPAAPAPAPGGSNANV